MADIAERPSLKDIAAMPFPASVEAMRKHYNKDWGKPVPDGVERKQRFVVRVNYNYRVSDHSTVEVEAWSKDEAEEIASDKVEDDLDLPWDADFEIDDCEVSDVPAEQVQP